jgi:hypothetical protein
MKENDAEQKSTCAGIMGAIDSHLRSRNTLGEARRDLEAIINHAEERLNHLSWFLEVGEHAKPKPPPTKDSV